MKPKGIVSVVFVGIVCVSCLYFLINTYSSQETPQTQIEFVTVENEDVEVQGSFLNKSSFSVEFWFKPTENYNWTTLLSFGNQDDYFILTTRGNPNNQEIGLSLSLKLKDKVQRFSSPRENTLLLNQYNYVVLSYSHRTMYIYLNGQLVSQGLVEGDLGRLKKETTIFGKSTAFSDPYAKGILDAFSIHNYSLTETQISSNYNEQYLSYLATLIEFPQEVLRDECIPLTHDLHGVSIKWMDDSSNYIQDSCLDTHSLNADLHLNAILESPNSTYQKEFSVTILDINASTKLNRDYEYLKQWMPKLLSESDELIQDLPNGSKVAWTTQNPDAQVLDYHLTKKTEGKLELRIIATLSNEDVTESYPFDIVLIDPYVGYLMSYFSEIKVEQEIMNFAYSYDGLNWIKLDSLDQNLNPTIGSQRVRDPFILRTNDGNFMVLATEAWDSQSIYTWSSSDLITFSEANEVRFTYYEPGISLTGKRAWAPEAIYDPINDDYLITFSDNEAKGIYSVRTRDFLSYSYPNLFIQSQTPIIDAHIEKTEDGYFVWLKDERSTHLSIFNLFSTSLDFNHSIRNDFLTDSKVALEGPFTVRNNNSALNDYLYIDAYENGYYEIYEIIDRNENSFRKLDRNEFQLPSGGIRHANVISLTKTELDSLISTNN